MERYTWDRPRIGTDLDAIKFICKEFWMEVFRKQVCVRAWLCMAWASHVRFVMPRRGGTDGAAVQLRGKTCAAARGLGVLSAPWHARAAAPVMLRSFATEPEVMLH